ncbi:MAG TPA: hypothetical protein VNM48_03840 [Chloroflexota bacterium]|nr:hypothetical protein [Chloroflexota bacterium]
MAGTALDSRINGFAAPPEPPPLPAWAPPQDALAAVAPVPPRQGPRAPHIEDWVDVPGYPDHKARVWLNFPNRLLTSIAESDQRTAAEALCQIVLEHNGWCDEHGEPYPPASDPTFWETLSTHQAAALIAAVRTRATAAPLAAAPRGR